MRRPALSTLPADIVHLIFKEIIPASYKYTPSLPNGPSNPRLQVLGTKVALPLICRALYWEGMSVLYHDIVLRRMWQIFALACTLRSPRGPEICFLIKNIAMDSCPVGGKVASTAKEELRSILRQCHVLHSLAYHPHPNFPFLSDETKSRSRDVDSYFNPTWFFHVSMSQNQPPFLDGPLASRLRRLDLRFLLTQSRLRNLHDLLLATASLRSLNLDYSVQDPLPKALEGFSPVQLPSLIELYMPFGQDANFDEYFCSRWDMPKLARLTLVSLEWWLERPLERFGQRLVYLHLFARYFRDPISCNPHPCPGLAWLCPILEHLIIPNPHNCLQQTPKTMFDSPTLKHLDIWDFGTHERLTSRARYYPWLESPSSGGWVEKIRSNNSLPCLRTVRSLFTEYGKYRGVDWPSICHPDLLFHTPDEEIWHSFPEAYVAQAATRLVPHSPHLLSDDDVYDESTSESDSDDDWTLSTSPDETDGSSETSHWTDEEVAEDVVEGDYL